MIGTKGDRQTDKQAGRQADRRASGQAGRQAGRQREREREIQNPLTWTEIQNIYNRQICITALHFRDIFFFLRQGFQFTIHLTLCNMIMNNACSGLIAMIFKVLAITDTPWNTEHLLVKSVGL